MSEPHAVQLICLLPENGFPHIEGPVQDVILRDGKRHPLFERVAAADAPRAIVVSSGPLQVTNMIKYPVYDNMHDSRQ